MIHFYLKQYKQGESLDIFNAPHKYRVALRGKSSIGSPIAERMFSKHCDQCLRIWETEKARIFDLFLTQVLKSGIETNDVIYLCYPPSKVSVFNDDLQKFLSSKLANSINVTACFKKVDGAEMLVAQATKTDEQLLQLFAIDNSEILKIDWTRSMKVLLVDDVYARGNTMRAMELLLKSIKQGFEIVKGVILKTA
jgi:hypothetical protein